MQLNEKYFTQEEIQFIKWYDKIRCGGRSYKIDEKYSSLIQCVYFPEEYIRKIDLELKILKAENNT